jgi:hypothetical protein
LGDLAPLLPWLFGIGIVAVLVQVQAGIPSFVWKDAGGPASGYSPGA